MATAGMFLIAISIYFAVASTEEYATEILLTQIGRYYAENASLSATKRAAIDLSMQQLFVINTDEMTIDKILLDTFYENGTNETLTSIDFIKEINASIDVESLWRATQPVNKQNESLNDMSCIHYDEINNLIYTIFIPSNYTNDAGYILVINGTTFDVINNNIFQLTKYCYSPKHIITTNDGSKVIIACSGENYPKNVMYPAFDPKSHIVIINVVDITDTAKYEKYDFYQAFITDDLFVNVSDSVYKVYPTETISEYFEHGAEPNYLSINNNDTLLYITFQESNAVAVFDLINNKFIKIFGMGFKDFSISGLDASDMDNGINIKIYDGLYGIRQPNMVQFYYDDITENEYLIAINEGKSNVFDAVRFNDKNIELSLLNETIMNGTLNELRMNESLGRLMISTFQGNIYGTDGNGTELEFENIYSFGSRDFSVYKINNNDDDDDELILDMIFDSSDDFENITAEYLDEIGFNSDANYAPSTDIMSPYIGVGANSMVYGYCFDDINNTDINLLFISSSTSGGIFVYDITDINNITFKTYINNRNFSIDYINGTRPDENAGDVGIEQLIFIQSDIGFGLQPLLISINVISSSITVYTVDCSSIIIPTTTSYQDDDDGNNNNNNNKILVIALCASGGALCLIIIIIILYCNRDKLRREQSTNPVIDHYIQLAGKDVIIQEN